jgi:hypothetical protein
MDLTFLMEQQNMKIRKNGKSTNAYKNYMSIAVFVLTTSQAARNNGFAARQESNRSRQLLIIPIVVRHFEKSIYEPFI